MRKYSNSHELGHPDYEEDVHRECLHRTLTFMQEQSHLAGMCQLCMAPVGQPKPRTKKETNAEIKRLTLELDASEGLRAKVEKKANDLKAKLADTLKTNEDLVDRVKGLQERVSEAEHQAARTAKALAKLEKATLDVVLSFAKRGKTMPPTTIHDLVKMVDVGEEIQKAAEIPTATL